MYLTFSLLLAFTCPAPSVTANSLILPIESARTTLELQQRDQDEVKDDNLPLWWELAFRDKQWNEALRRLRGLPAKEQPPECKILEEYLQQEVDPTPEAECGPWEKSGTTQSALNWADWYLRVAPNRKGGITAEVLDAVRLYILEICPNPKHTFWVGFNSAAEELYKVSSRGDVNALVALEAMDLSGQIDLIDREDDTSEVLGWSRLEKNKIPKFLESQRFIAFKDTYKIEEHITLQSGAELWVERGTTLAINGRKINDDIVIELNGHIRIFGGGDKPVKIEVKYVGSERTDPFSLIYSRGVFQHYIDLSFELTAKDRACTALSGVPHKARIQHCSFNGKKIDRGHNGIHCGPRSDVVISDCFFTSLNEATSGAESNLFFLRNTFEKNRYAFSSNWTQGCISVRETDFIGNEYDLYINDRTCGYGGNFVFRDCNLESTLFLSEGAAHSYDLRRNYWKKGADRQIFEFDSSGASRAQYQDEIKKEIKEAGARKHPGG